MHDQERLLHYVQLEGALCNDVAYGILCVYTEHIQQVRLECTSSKGHGSCCNRGCLHNDILLHSEAFHALETLQQLENAKAQNS